MAQASSQKPSLKVTVFSDYICPFCYVGDARLDALRDEYDLEVEWNWFEIHPDNPAEGKPVSELGYDPQRWAQMMASLEAMAEREGLPLAKRTFTTNSHKALLLAEAVKALDLDVFERLHKRLFDAYFRQARNIGDEKVLRDIADECEIPEDVVEQAWNSQELEHVLKAQNVRSAQLGISGVPAYIIGRYLVPGAVPVEVLRQAAREALAEANTEEKNSDD